MEHYRTPAAYIRQHIFKAKSQRVFAEMLNLSVQLVSHVETGRRPMSREYQDRVRALAKAKGLRWDNNWLFEIPKSMPRQRKLRRKRNGA